MQVNTLTAGLGRNQNISLVTAEPIYQCSFHISGFRTADTCRTFVFFQPRLVNGFGASVVVGAVEYDGSLRVATAFQKIMKVSLGPARLSEHHCFTLPAEAFCHGEGFFQHREQGLALGVAGDALGQIPKFGELGNFLAQSARRPGGLVIAGFADALLVLAVFGLCPIVYFLDIRKSLLIKPLLLFETLNHAF